MAVFSEDQVHQHLYQIGLKAVIVDCPEFDGPSSAADDDLGDVEEEDDDFQLWCIIKARAFSRLRRLHRSVRYGDFIGSKVKLPTDGTKPMELDLLGTHEDGLFVLELKVERSAERNAFSELFAYSNYIAGMFALPGWFDSEEEDGSLNDWTKEHLAGLSGYAAQLMEAERLHGFCFIRKPWKEVPLYYRNSLFICAVNPFHIAEIDRTSVFLEQLDEQYHSSFLESPQFAFSGRLIRLAQRALKDSLTHNYGGEAETPYWGAIVTSVHEVAITHNFAFRPTGMLREAYVSYLNGLYVREPAGKGSGADVSTLKINEINNWLGAWMFMEGCGFKAGEASDADDADE